MKYNPEFHHRKSIRLKGYDYSKPGKYFITICTKNRECLFGKIVDGRMMLNSAGKFAHECWMKIPEHFPNVILHPHVVMPNHVHGIIELVETVGAQNIVPVKNPPIPNVGVQNFEPLSVDRKQNQFQKIIPHSIGSIVRGFKIGVTKWFHDHTDIYVVWQRNFHEHIIRNDQEFYEISNYIINNPKNWEQDKFYL